MNERSYWLDLFTGTTWQEFLRAGGDVSGFRESRWKTVQRIKPGDYLLCYLTGVSRFIGVLEVTSEAFKDTGPIWKDDAFPCRLGVKVVSKLEPETAVPVQNLRDVLTAFQNLSSPHAWTGHFRGSPAKWKANDGKAVLDAILEAAQNPVVRKLDPKKLARRPTALRAKIGPVTVPEVSPVEDEKVETQREVSAHTESQHLLLKLGADMGLNVWVARNDLSREVKGQRFSDLPQLTRELPLQFDDATNKTIGLIDVLWLQSNRLLLRLKSKVRLRSTRVCSACLTSSPCNPTWPCRCTLLRQTSAGIKSLLRSIVLRSPA